MTVAAVMIASAALVLALVLAIHWITIRNELDRVREAMQRMAPPADDDPYGFDTQLDVIRRGRFGGSGGHSKGPRDGENN